MASIRVKSININQVFCAYRSTIHLHELFLSILIYAANENAMFYSKETTVNVKLEVFSTLLAARNGRRRRDRGFPAADGRPVVGHLASLTAHNEFTPPSDVCLLTISHRYTVLFTSFPGLHPALFSHVHPHSLLLHT